jgi:uncharacterized protein YcaQ
VELSAAAARRFLVARHFLGPPRSLPARAKSVLTVVRHLGSLQFDPLESPGARNHELVLAARVRGYRRGWCERWLYGPERELFEAYNKSLNILPIEELPYHRLAWQRGSARHAELLGDHEADVTQILASISARGPLPTSHFSRELNQVLPGGWGPTLAGRLLVEGLFKAGRLGISRREGNARWYDLVERLFPAELLARRVEEAESVRHRLLTRFRGIGLLGGTASPEVTVGTGTPAQRKEIIVRLGADGTIIPVTVEGLKGIRYILREEQKLLRQIDIGAEVTFLAPLDPLLWDRRLLRDLFQFEYTWEVYMPVGKRKHGYYVLPILYGDRLVGRVEPRMDRAASVLTVAGLWLEAGFRPERRFRAAFDEALEAHRQLAGADRVKWASAAARRFHNKGGRNDG